MFRSLAAGPREAGTDSASQARQALQHHFESLGFSVLEEPFEFSAQALWAFPVLGVGLGALGLLEVPLLCSPEWPAWVAITGWFAGLVLLALVCARLMAVPPLPGFSIRHDSNLIATRGEAPVSCWVVAHVDSKAQGHSMAGRLVALWFVLLAIAFISLMAVWRLATAQPVPFGLVVLGAGFAVLAGALAMRGRLKGTSAGARDNGTGILAALVAAQSVPDRSVGFILTGAEEFGLAGAQHLVRTGAERFRGTDVINLDTLADRGRIYVVTHQPSGLPLARRMMEVLAPLGPPVYRKLPIGILVDSVPLARVAARAVTVSRLDWSVLRLMHTSRDALEGLDTGFAESVGRAVASALAVHLPRV